jgi:DNA-binding XRE family transcriptional regulator
MFGLLVLKHRRRMGLTQEELADKSGLSVRTVRRLEGGESLVPRAASVRRLAAAFHLHGPEWESFLRSASGAKGRPTPASVGRDGEMFGGARSSTVVPAAAGGWVVHCLPRPATHFIGRDAEVARLLSAVDRHRRDRPMVVTLDGMAGEGKTALALELAHRLADRYPGGHLFLDLRGHSNHSQLESRVALGLLLTQLGVPAYEIPETLEGRKARWCTEVATRPVLTVLDNAASSEQVRPLVPGRSAALVLVTSRRRLVGLDSDEHATLRPLDDTAAVSLLAGLIGEERMDGYHSDAREVAKLCGNLPLALHATAAWLRHQPTRTLADLVRRLHTALTSAMWMSAEGMTVAAALTLSDRQLSEPASFLLRGLGLHGVEDVDEHTAALVEPGPADV